MSESRKKAYYACFAAAALLSALALSPLVIPTGVAEPWVLGMPRTLWAGILITGALVFLTFLAGRFAPTDLDEPEAPQGTRTTDSRGR